MKKILICIIICFNAPCAFAQQGVHSFPLVPPPATQGAGGMQDINQMVGGNSALSNEEVSSLLNPGANTTGTRLFLGKWMKGSINTASGITVNVDSALYAYDKISHNLYYTVNDKKTIMEADAGQIISFNLKDGEKDYRFVRVPLINPAVFFQVLVADSAKYSLYKLINTRFIAANFKNNGYFTTGSQNNQYQDKYEYYVVFPGQNTYQKIELRKRSIRNVFGKSNPRLKAYFSQNDGGDGDEGFLVNLVKYMDGYSN